jgi:multicomponent Na+:H+ antiporter subunit E
MASGKCGRQVLSKQESVPHSHIARRSHFSIATWVMMFALWIILSGKFDVFHLGAGLITIAIVAWLQSLLVPMRKENEPRIRLVPVLLYIPWLLWQMVLSALLVARLILWDRKSIDPRIVVFRSNQPSVVHHTVFANSITLTPGTLTVDLQGDRYLVHAICERTENDLLNGPMARKVARLSGLDIDSQPVRMPVKDFANG